MELKEYQQKTVDQIKTYLEALDRWRDKSVEVIKVAGLEAALDFPLKAWEETVKTTFQPCKNGLGQPLPSFCLKIPTGGGKTLLAVKT